MTVGAIEEFATILPWLQEGDEVSVTMKAGAWRRAFEMATGGPAVMSTRQAADVFGWSPRRWRGWAKQGLIEDAYQEEDEDGRLGPWRLPREGCRQRVEEEAQRGRSRARSVDPKGHTEEPLTTGAGRNGTRNLNTNGRSIRRGPRKSEAG